MVKWLKIFLIILLFAAISVATYFVLKFCGITDVETLKNIIQQSGTGAVQHDDHRHEPQEGPQYDQGRQGKHNILRSPEEPIPAVFLQNRLPVQQGDFFCFYCIHRVKNSLSLSAIMRLCAIITTAQNQKSAFLHYILYIHPLIYHIFSIIATINHRKTLAFPL